MYSCEMVREVLREGVKCVGGGKVRSDDRNSVRVLLTLTRRLVSLRA